MEFVSTLLKQKHQGSSCKEQVHDKYEPSSSQCTATQPPMDLWLYIQELS